MIDKIEFDLSNDYRQLRKVYYNKLSDALLNLADLSSEERSVESKKINSFKVLMEVIFDDSFGESNIATNDIVEECRKELTEMGKRGQGSYENFLLVCIEANRKGYTVLPCTGHNSDDVEEYGAVIFKHIHAPYGDPIEVAIHLILENE